MGLSGGPREPRARPLAPAAAATLGALGFSVLPHRCLQRPCTCLWASVLLHGRLWLASRLTPLQQGVVLASTPAKTRLQVQSFGGAGRAVFSCLRATPEQPGVWRRAQERGPTRGHLPTSSTPRGLPRLGLGPFYHEGSGSTRGNTARTLPLPRNPPLQPWHAGTSSLAVLLPQPAATCTPEGLLPDRGRGAAAASPTLLPAWALWDSSRPWVWGAGKKAGPGQEKRSVGSVPGGHPSPHPGTVKVTSFGNSL